MNKYISLMTNCLKNIAKVFFYQNNSMYKLSPSTFFPYRFNNLSKIQFHGLFQFCGPCLRNRYGEEAREVLKNPVSCKYSETPHEDHL